MLSDWESHIWFSKTKWKDKTSYITEQAQVISDYIFIYLFIAKLFSLLAMTRVNSGGALNRLNDIHSAKKTVHMTLVSMRIGGVRAEAVYLTRPGSAL